MKKSRFGSFLFAAVLGVGALSMTGCVVVVAGAAAAGTVAYVRGSLKATLPAGVEKLEGVVKSTLTDDLKFALISAREDALGAEYVVRTSQDRKVVITLERFDDKLTKIEIRVGTLGDESTSRLILNQIEHNLD